jgi:hypothetical protein
MLRKKFDEISRKSLTSVTRCGIMGAAQAKLICKLKNNHRHTTTGAACTSRVRRKYNRHYTTKAPAGAEKAE